MLRAGAIAGTKGHHKHAENTLTAEEEQRRHGIEIAPSFRKKQTWTQE